MHSFSVLYYGRVVTVATMTWLTVTEYLSHDHGYVPFVVITIWFFQHSWLMTGFGTRVARQVPHVEQERPSLPENMSSPLVLVGFVLLDLSFSVQCFADHCLFFSFFSIVISVFLRYTTSDYPLASLNLSCIIAYSWTINIPPLYRIRNPQQRHKVLQNTF